MGAVFERVVVGVDGTDLAFEALRQALVLAPAAGSTVRAVTALDTSAAARTGFDAAHWTEALTREATTTREKAEAILGGRPGTSAKVVTGDPVRVLRDTRDELDATLLAVGGQHSSRFLGILLGDVGTQLLRDDKSSVLVARPGRDRAWKPRAVVVGLDGSAPSLAALEAADELATRLDSVVETVSATDGRPVSREGDWTNRVDAWEDAQPAPLLVERSRHADLIVVGSRGLHGIRALGSVSERVAHRGQCSVLVVAGAPQRAG
jgi:nucleotide-binding universal stress UspA family protein